MSEPATLPDRIGFPGFAWALYDFGYSLFAFVLFARYLSDWVIVDLGKPDYFYTTAQAAAALLLFALMPICGVLADVLGRHTPVLAAASLVAAGGGILLGIASPDIGAFGILPVLLLGTIAAAATGLAFSQFDPLLAAVAPRSRWGLMSGLAVAAGYLGIILWLVVFAERVVGEGDKQAAFLPASLVFLACAVPLFVFVREPRHGDPDVGAAAREHGIVRTARMQLRGVIGRLREHPAVLRLLAGRLLYADAVGTVQVYAVVYISRLGTFSESDKDRAILVVVIFAGLGALAAGWLAGRIGPRRTLLSVMPMFAAGLGLVALSGEPWTIWVLSPVVGVSLGTIYAVDRVFMLALTPPEIRGEMFGFFNLVGRAGQAIGPFILWGGVIFVLHDLSGWLTALDASRVALGLLALSALAGLLIVRPLDDGWRSRTIAPVDASPAP